MLKSLDRALQSPAPCNPTHHVASSTPHPCLPHTLLNRRATCPMRWTLPPPTQLLLPHMCASLWSPSSSRSITRPKSGVIAASSPITRSPGSVHPPPLSPIPPPGSRRHRCSPQPGRSLPPGFLASVLVPLAHPPLNSHTGLSLNYESLQADSQHQWICLPV